MKAESQPVTDDDRLKRLMAYAEQNLTEQTLRVFRMRHLQGMKYQEIAHELGISRVMVYKHLAQAMEKIREYIIS
jgi:RNA polymerase sigma-70 factor (ECF subfamily)